MNRWNKVFLYQLFLASLGGSQLYADQQGVVGSAKDLASGVLNDPSLLVGVAAVGAGTTGALGGLSAASLPLGHYIINNWKEKNKQKSIEEEARKRAVEDFKANQRGHNVFRSLLKPKKEGDDPRSSVEEDLKKSKETGGLLSGLSEMGKVRNAALDLVTLHSGTIESLKEEYRKEAKELAHMTQAGILSPKQKESKKRNLAILKEMIKYHKDFIQTGGEKALAYKEKLKNFSSLDEAAQKKIKESLPAFTAFKELSRGHLVQAINDNNIKRVSVDEKGNVKPLKIKVLKDYVPDYLRQKRAHQRKERNKVTKE